MDDTISSPPSPNCRKRPAPDDTPSKKALNLQGTQFMMPTPPDTDQSSNTSPDGSANHDRQERATSPALSTSTALSSVIDVPPPQSSSLTAGASTTPTASSSGPPAKRRKLTPSEKLEKARLKEAKDREIAEKKAKAEEAKAAKAEEKRIKDEEKAEEKRIKDQEKQKKAEEQEAKKREVELEKERKEQAKLAKERSQMRLGAFFQRPATAAADGEEQQIRSRRKSLSLEPFDAVADIIKSTASPARGTPPPSAKKREQSDYQKTFLSFELRPNTTIAPRAQVSDADNDKFDYELNDSSIKEKYDLGLVASYASVETYFGPASRRGLPYPNIQKIVEKLQGYSQQPIDLTDDGPAENGVEVLRKIPVRHIHHHEDVRPAYIGTYTKIRSPRIIKKVMRNPFTKARPDTNYDYDSEAEWEEPEEGDEEILDEDDDEADSQADAGEMEDFLDDEDDANKNRRKAMITTDLVAESTGLCWEDQKGRVEFGDIPKGHEVSDMSIGVLLPGFSGSTIDPFATSYWDEAPLVVAPAKADLPVITSTGLMAPPRPPLQPKLNFSGTQMHDLIGAAEGQKGPITSVAASQGGKRGPKPAPKTLSKEDLAEFTEAVVGSPLGKLDLQKGLKSRYVVVANDQQTNLSRC